MKDSDFGPHETWCDIRIGISLTCNCMASTYIEQIQDSLKMLEEMAQAADKIALAITKDVPYIKGISNLIGVVESYRAWLNKDIIGGGE